MNGGGGELEFGQEWKAKFMAPYCEQFWYFAPFWGQQRSKNRNKISEIHAPGDSVDVMPISKIFNAAASIPDQFLVRRFFGNLFQC